MKKLIYFIALFLSIGFTYSQQASDYFPEQSEVRWEYKATVLDSLNNEIDSLTYYRHDLFFREDVFEGKLAKIIKTKSGPIETIQFQPYIDSIFFHFSGSDGYEYFKLGIIKNLILVLDSLISDSTFSVLDFFQSLEQWYKVYRFGQSIGDEYTILQIDTTITIGTETVPLRLEYLGERYSDETISTPIDSFECKKFARKIGVSYLIYLPPPLPPLVIPILFLEDFVWIAEDYWIVKGMIPSTDVDLQIIGIDPFYIPGLVTKLDTIVFDTTSSVTENHFNPGDFLLSQNYPNPFNPSTRIKFTISNSGFVNLKIYDILGKEVATLVNEEKPAGTYIVEWNATGLPSGVYFYKLKTENLIETKKMILLR
jgi:hypothetical protein